MLLDSNDRFGLKWYLERGEYSKYNSKHKFVNLTLVDKGFDKFLLFSCKCQLIVL